MAEVKIEKERKRARIDTDTDEQEPDQSTSRCECSSCIVCKWFLSEPRFILKVMILILGIALIIFQLAKGAIKLRSSNDMTKTYLHVNTTLHYPALTICQQPWPEPENAMNITFDQKGIFESISLNNDSSMEVAKIISKPLPFYGMCYTILPNKTTNSVGKHFGYDIKLRHTTISSIFPRDKDRKSYGWHIFIHESKHVFGEHCLTDGHADHQFLRVGKEMELKIKAQRFARNSNCADDPEVHACYIDCINDLFDRKKCSKNSNGSKCEGIKAIENDLSISQLNQRLNCNCPKVCIITIYDSFVQKTRNTDILPVTNKGRLMAYYTSKAFVNVREKGIYDGAQFVSNLAGMLAFFLGLSIPAMFDATYKYIAAGCCSKNKLWNE